MYINKLLAIVVVFFVLSSTSQAGWNPLKETFKIIEGAGDTMRKVADPGHYEKKAKKKARAQIISEKNKSLNKFNKEISILKKSIVSFEKDGTKKFDVALLNAELKFRLDTKKSVEEIYDKALSEI